MPAQLYNCPKPTISQTQARLYQQVFLQPATAAVGATMTLAPIARPANASSPIPNANMRARFIEISHS